MLILTKTTRLVLTKKTYTNSHKSLQDSIDLTKKPTLVLIKVCLSMWRCTAKIHVTVIQQFKFNISLVPIWHIFYFATCRG